MDGIIERVSGWRGSFLLERVMFWRLNQSNCCKIFIYSIKYCSHTSLDESGENLKQKKSEVTVFSG